MGNLAKQIIDGLRVAKVSAGDQSRAKRMIDEASEWDLEEAAEIEAVVRYVCGVGALPDVLSKGLLENRGAKLLHGLSQGRELDGWDTRALDVIAPAKEYYWFWELDRWLCERVVKYPDEPIFDEALELFRARGLWPDDASIQASMSGQLRGHVTEQGELTSTGRWMLATFDRDAGALLELARKQTADKTSSLYRLLLVHRRDLFDELVPKLELKKDSDRSYLAEIMLEVDAARYEEQSVALMAGLTAPIAAVLSARNLEKFFPGKYRAEVKRLLLATVKAKNVPFLCEGEAADTRALAYTMAWAALGDEALDIWRAYREENDATRLDFYATIARQAEEKALPWLIDGLVYPKDPKVEYGGLDHGKYVQRMLKLLEPYDLVPHRARIEQAFAKTKSKKVRELIDPVLGKAKPVEPKATAKPFAGKTGYRFEAYAGAVTKAALAAVKKAKTLPSPIEQVKLGGMQGDVQLNWLSIEGVGAAVELELSGPRCKVPQHIDYTDDDKVLPKFMKLHALDEDDAPTWGDMYKLPWCVLLHEQLLAVHAIADGLRAQGHVLAEDCKLGVGADDDFWDSASSFEEMSRGEVAALPEAQQADFAAVCFEDPDRQRWLLTR